MTSRISVRQLRLFVVLLVALMGIVGTSNPSMALSPTYSVTFHNNVPGVANISVIQQENVPTALQSFSTMNFTNPNYFFEYWTTQQNGSGVIYQDQSPYLFDADIELYAHWVQSSHTVTFFSNLTSTDTTHVTETNNASANLTSLATLGFSNSNYTFTGWNTQRNGSGTTYADQATYPFLADITLYAQWAPTKYDLLFSSNSGSGSVSSISSAYGSVVTLPRGGSLSKPGYELMGWNTQPQGNGTEYPLGSSINVTRGETLYAQWSRLSIVISFSVPGVMDKIAPITIDVGKPIHLRSLSELLKPGFSFEGWFSKPHGGKFIAAGGAMFTPTTSVTLYAQWRSNSLVGLEFSDNGGVGHIRAQQIRSGQTVVIPSGAGLRRPGYLFRGWASSPHAPQPSVRIGTRIILTHTRILYALWRRQLAPTTPQLLLGSVGIFAPNSSALTLKMRLTIASLARSVDQHDRTAIVLYGYATSMDTAKGSALLSLKRALAVQKQLDADLVSLNDVGVTVRAVGEGRLTNSVLASFRNVEIFAN
ncbi:MAG: InlB B-repeat-containing protein [Actinomycetota bacterium]|nr:InlB B-repeat-containing protein [Actinomycetota bacterium]